MEKCETCNETYELDETGFMIAGDCVCELPWNFGQGASE